MEMYGISDSEKEFLKYLNSQMKIIKLVSLEDYQDFQKYPEKRKTELEKDYDSQIQGAKDKDARAYNRNKTIFNDLKKIRGQIFYKEKSLRKYWGDVKERVKSEVLSLKRKLEKLENELDQNKTNMSYYKSEIKRLAVEKRSSILYANKDRINIERLNKDSNFTNLRKGAFGENNVIKHLKQCFKDTKDCYLINGFDLDVYGKAINIDNHTLKEAKLDHIILFSKGLFILETKAWKTYNQKSVDKVKSQLKKIRKVFDEIFSGKIDLGKMKLYLVCTEKFIPLDNSIDYSSLKLDELYETLSKSEEIFTKEDITMILSEFLPHLNEGHLSRMGQRKIKFKSFFVKTKRYVKGKFKKKS